MPAFDWLDLLIVAIALLAAIHGYHRGAGAQLLAYSGLGLGLIVGVAIAPLTVGLVGPPLARVVVSLAVIVGAGVLVGGNGGRVGLAASHLIRRMHLGLLDSVAGAALGAAGLAFMVCVIVAGVLVGVSSPGLRSAIASSTVLARVDRTLPVARPRSRTLPNGSFHPYQLRP